MNKKSNIEDFIPRILELYKKGMSTSEIEELVHLPVLQRQVLREIHKKLHGTKVDNS